MMLARILTAVALMWVSGGSVRAGDTGWKLRTYGVLVDAQADATTNATAAAMRVDTGGGLGVAGEYRLSYRMGIEVSALFADLDMEIKSSGFGASATRSLSFGIAPLSFGMNLHLNPLGRADLFVGPTISHVSYSELEAHYDPNGSTFTVGGSSDTAFGAALGVDVPLGQGKWSVCMGLRYIATDTAEADIDPLFVTFGFGRRFR